jgi:hypothetical protein
MKFIWCLGWAISWSYQMEKLFRKHGESCWKFKYVLGATLVSMAMWPLVLGSAFGDVYFDTHK